MLLPRLLERVRAHAQAALRLHWRAQRAAMLLSVASSEGCRVEREGGGKGRPWEAGRNYYESEPGSGDQELEVMSAMVPSQRVVS